MVSIGEQGPDVLTKLHKSLADVSYTIHDEDAEDDVDIEEEDDDEEEEEEEEEDERKKKKTKKKSTNGDAALARRIAKEEESRAAMSSRKSSRLAKHAESAEDIQEGSAIRERKQIELMKRRNEERLQELARGNRKDGQKSDSDQPEELETYRRTKEYPDNIQPNQVKVDMANQCVILPICGNPIPFHISTIKNVVLPDPDSATYLRINFYTAGMAVGKDAPENMAKLVAKYAPYATFIREMTFRSLDSQNLTLAFRQISELRKRARTRELRLQEEANLVEQDKLVRTKNERVPRLSDLTMRPVVAGRKTQGNLEAHSNGLRFISTRAEVVDIMYSNIKYAIFQPCENEIMVLVHFHLKNAIMVGKKRQFDIQFFTEVVDASQTVDAGRRSMYDPDEMDDEQRERQLRKKLNAAFRDFCKKVDAVAKKNNFNLEFDIPYRDLGFIGNPHKEMVMIQPTLNCLVNLTETPFFVVDLADLDHVHFERVTYMSKAFDVVLINKDFTKQPWRIDMIDNGDKDAIQDWLTDMEITYTEGPMNLNWKQIIQTVAADDRFYMNTEEDEVTDKEAGWEFLRLYGHDDDEEDDEEDEDSGYSEAPGEEEEEDDDDDDVEEDFDSEDEDDDDDFDADEELEEQGMDWEDMEKQAILDDRRGRSQETSNDNVRRPDTHDKKRRRENVAPPSSSSRRSAPPPNKHARRR
jgi:nucleosome binding factor SPN SPT16 subunit